jgi:hypothetical protein
MIDNNKILDCCKECEYDCKQHQWQFDDITKMSGCILADVEMTKIMANEKMVK